MATGLFEALRRYSLKENRDPLENFITEGFAWILNNYPDFGEFFLQHLEAKLKERGREWSIGNYGCEWLTQESFDGKYPDMVCHFNGENKAIIFEHKTWSRLHQNQLANYKEYAKRNFDEYRVVLITATQQQHEQDPDLPLCWSDIYNLISDWEKRDNNELLFRDFQQLLKSVGLGPPAPISHTSIRYYYETRDLKENINGLIERVKGREEQKKEWKKMIKKDYDLSHRSQRGKYDNNGRIGLELLSSDDPNHHRPRGIFVGILVDGEEHKTEPIDRVKGPDFCLIISFSPSLHDFYNEENHYKKLVEELPKKVKQLNDGWQFYDHLKDFEAPRKNKYHPIHIRKPMLDVFCGTESCEDQEERFYEAARELIKLVVEEESFWALRESCKEYLSQQG